MAEFADLVISHAVMEHIDDLKGMYRAIHHWLRPGGMAPHKIDYRCHGTSSRWNAHWTCSGLTWNLLWGRRPYPLNREPHSTHLRLLEKYGHTVLADIRTRQPSAISRSELAGQFKTLSEDDLTTSGAHIVTRKD